MLHVHFPHFLLSAFQFSCEKNKRDNTGKVISKSFAWGLTGEKYAIEGQIIVPKKKEQPKP